MLIIKLPWRSVCLWRVSNSVSIVKRFGDVLAGALGCTQGRTETTWRSSIISKLTNNFPRSVRNLELFPTKWKSPTVGKGAKRREIHRYFSLRFRFLFFGTGVFSCGTKPWKIVLFSNLLPLIANLPFPFRFLVEIMEFETRSVNSLFLCLPVRKDKTEIIKNPIRNLKNAPNRWVLVKDASEY